MNNRGNMKATRTVVPLLLSFTIFYASSSLASGVLIFSSWDTSEKAEKDADRISGIVEQKATTMEATVNDRKVFRVVVAVATEEDRSSVMQTATDKNLKPWYLKTEQIAESSDASDATSSTPEAGTADASSDTGDSSSSNTPIVLSVNDADPVAVLQYLDQATINSTIEKLDAVRERAQDLIPEFEHRAVELPPSEDLPKIPDRERSSEDEQQVGTSDSADTEDTE